MWSPAATVVFNCPHSRGSIWQVFCPRSRPCGAFSPWLQGTGLFQAGVSCGDCPSLVSAQQGSQRSLGSPGPSILQRPPAWGPCNPHTLSDSGVSLPSAAAWKVQAVSRALAGSWGSRTAITQCVKVVVARVVKTSLGGAGREPPCRWVLVDSGRWAGFWGSSCIWGSLCLLFLI